MCIRDRSYSKQIVYKAYHLGGYTTPDLATATNEERVTGMFRLILIVIALYVIGAVLTGMTFFAMAWTGQHVLRSLRVEVFEKLHTLSLSSVSYTHLTLPTSDLV